jgi:uncharacterized membrane protein
MTEYVVIETRLRSLLKALSWRILATLTTAIVAYGITGEVNTAVAIGSIEFFLKFFIYYAHVCGSRCLRWARPKRMRNLSSLTHYVGSTDTQQPLSKRCFRNILWARRPYCDYTVCNYGVFCVDACIAKQNTNPQSSCGMHAVCVWRRSSGIAC